ncbi:uncharacterized protein BDR25DRAFT_362918 [Lindgomyces ingoldianus]|uniref:Uncharacterized protein n=1 Tax=Lindgomyces ingoldianus TaxID=673940 RepID=A0ACB6Q904_9PLEO|nr:uncharacterized protein BDR25DRAFT_362918 [Lindgomyces ingoldianus]KAF2463376.1 hypothetical protein BDR25DRAFT_362918 [Lindgomyces ingoldianus]
MLIPRMHTNIPALQSDNSSGCSKRYSGAVDLFTPLALHLMDIESRRVRCRRILMDLTGCPEEQAQVQGQFNSAEGGQLCTSSACLPTPELLTLSAAKTSTTAMKIAELVSLPVKSFVGSRVIKKHCSKLRTEGKENVGCGRIMDYMRAWESVKRKFLGRYSTVWVYIIVVARDRLSGSSAMNIIPSTQSALTRTYQFENRNTDSRQCILSKLKRDDTRVSRTKLQNFGVNDRPV